MNTPRDILDRLGALPCNGCECIRKDGGIPVDPTFALAKIECYLCKTVYYMKPKRMRLFFGWVLAS